MIPALSWLQSGVAAHFGLCDRSTAFLIVVVLQGIRELRLRCRTCDVEQVGMGSEPTIGAERASPIQRNNE